MVHTLHAAAQKGTCLSTALWVRTSSPLWLSKERTTVVLGRSINFLYISAEWHFCLERKSESWVMRWCKNLTKRRMALGSLKSCVGDDDEDGVKKILEAQSTEKCIRLIYYHNIQPWNFHNGENLTTRGKWFNYLKFYAETLKLWLHLTISNTNVSKFAVDKIQLPALRVRQSTHIAVFQHFPCWERERLSNFSCFSATNTCCIHCTFSSTHTHRCLCTQQQSASLQKAAYANNSQCSEPPWQHPGAAVHFLSLSAFCPPVPFSKFCHTTTNIFVRPRAQSALGVIQRAVRNTLVIRRGERRKSAHAFL